MAEITNADQARAVLDASRDQFRALVQGLSDVEWSRRSDNAGWTNGQLCWHIAYTSGSGDLRVSRLRESKGMNPPAPIMALLHLVSLWIVKTRSRGATPESVLALFEENLAKTASVVDTVGDDEWEKGAEFLGQPMTVGSAFRFIEDHIAEHSAEMRRD